MTNLATKTSALFKEAINLIREARVQAVKQTNTLLVYTYFLLGRLIVESEQGGKSKAA